MLLDSSRLVIRKDRPLPLQQGPISIANQEGDTQKSPQLFCRIGTIVCGVTILLLCLVSVSTTIGLGMLNNAVQLQHQKGSDKKGNDSMVILSRNNSAAAITGKNTSAFTGINGHEVQDVTDGTSTAVKPALWNENVINGTLYICGWSTGRLCSYLFPEFTQVLPLELETQSDNNSLLVFGLFGPCPPNRRSIDIEWVLANWTGKTLNFNSETRVKQDARNERNFVHGAVDVDNASNMNYTVRKTFCMAALLIGSYPVECRYQIFNHSLKPQSTKEKFAIYMASNCKPRFRDIAADSLTTIGVVDQGGKCAGKAGNKLSKLLPKPSRWKNTETFSKYRFCLVMENESYPGYVTEKILDAFLGGCIPIYYGTEQIFDIFNRKAFIYYNISDPAAALERIYFLENNRTAYDQVLEEEPILTNGSLDRFFSFADDIGNGTLKRRIRNMLGMSLY